MYLAHAPIDLALRRRAKDDNSYIGEVGLTRFSIVRPLVILASSPKAPSSPASSCTLKRHSNGGKGAPEEAGTGQEQGA